MPESARSATSAMVWSATAGDKQDPLVVLVHGSMDRSAGLLRLSRQLDTDRSVMRYDRRGYGRSSQIGPPWTVESHVDDLEVLLDKSVQRRATADGAVLFGHSFGGNVALSLSARRPDLVAAVAVYESPLSWLDWWPTNSAGAAAMAASDPDAAAEAFMRRLVGDAGWERLPESKRRERRSEGAAMLAELADLRCQAPWRGDQIQVPVLALRGERAGPHHCRAMDGLGDMIDDCRSAVVAGAGHGGPHTHAELVSLALRPVLHAVSRGA